MRDYLFILLGTALVNNVVLARFLGLCPFMGVSNKVDSALGMGMATTFVLTLAVAVSWLVERYVLIPLDIAFLRILAFILVIAALVGAGGLGMVLMPRNKVSQIGTAIPAAAAGGKA